MTWPLRMTKLRTLRWPRRGDEPQSLPRQVESIAEALDDDDGAADSTTATPNKKRGRKTESDAASRSKSADTPDKIEKLKQSDARRQASELAKTGDNPNVGFKDRVKHVTAVHTARQVVTHVHNLVENLQDAHMFPV